jgi:hypothetical protein
MSGVQSCEHDLTVPIIIFYIVPIILDVLVRVCKALQADIGYVVELVPKEKNK